MKLYWVDLLCNHCEQNCGLAIANSEEDAIKMVKEDYEIDFTYNEIAYPIEEIHGYKVVFKKGKKIVLEN